MTESEEMAPSMDRKWVESRHPEVYFEGPLAISERDALRLDSFQYGVKTSRDGGNSGDSKGGGGKDGGDGGGGGGGGGGDKDKSSNKSQDDKSNDNGDGGNNNNNNDNNNNSSKSQGDSTTTGIVTVTTALLLPPLAVPISSPVTPSLALTTTSTTSLTTSTTSVISVIETTSIVTSVQMATMTTIIPVVTILPTVQISSQPRKGVDGPGADPTSPFPVFGSPTSVDTIVSTATDVAATVTASAIADSDGSGNNTSGNNNKGSGGHSGKKDSDKNQPPGALDPAAEHALIAVGSIGAFVLICFVGWMVYRTFKKSRRGQYYNGGNSGFINKLPWRRNQNNGTWDNGGAYMSDDMPPPLYEKGNHNSMQNPGFYGQEKKYAQQQPGGLSRSNTTNSQRELLPRLLTPGSVVMIPAEQYLAMSQGQSPVGSDPASTLRSRMPDVFFNQSELARQPSDAYDPAMRQVNRASELSSLSSGFGDGDIIVPEEYLNKPQPAATQLRQSSNYITRFSWMSRRDAGDRETVYTTTEERPAKYRSVGSWVNQQTGRLKRSDERQQAIPPVPNIPQNVDGQEGMR